MRRAVVSILAIVSIILLPFICVAQAGKVAGASGDDGGGEITGTTGMAAGAVLASADVGDGNGVRAATGAAARSLQDAGKKRKATVLSLCGRIISGILNSPRMLQ